MSNEGNIKASILLILLKCIVVGYSNINKTFTGRLFSNYWSLNMLFHFFPISHLYCFSRDLYQKVYEETTLFQLKFQNPISRCRILQKIKMCNFVILSYPLKVKSWKVCPFLGLLFSEIKYADILSFSWIK